MVRKGKQRGELKSWFSLNCAAQVDVPKLIEGEKSDVQAKVKAVQDYLSALSYNHTGMQLFEIRKTRCICR